MDTTISVYALAFVAVIQAFAILNLRKKVTDLQKVSFVLTKTSAATVQQLMHVIEQHNGLINSLANKFGEQEP